MIDRRHIGAVSPPRYVDVDRARIASFARAIGEHNAIYFDEASARAAGYRSIPAPPTFGWTLWLIAEPIAATLARLGVAMADALHGEQSFTYHGALYAGDRIQLRSTVKDIYTKKGGVLEFLVREAAAHNQLGSLVQVQRTVIVVRRPAS